MSVVAGGLGQPESGQLVAAGLGASGSPSGFVNAYLSVTAESETTISVDVSDATPPAPPPANGGGRVRFSPSPRVPRYLDVAVVVECSAVASITATVTFNFDAELEQLLLVGAI